MTPSPPKTLPRDFFDEKKKPIDYSAKDPNVVDYDKLLPQRSGPDPTLSQQMREWWSGKSDAEKQDWLDSGGEFIGGALGALAGGPTPAAIAGAGAGSVAGKSGARLLGKAMGLKPEKSQERKALEAQFGTGGAEVADLAITGARNALGQGIGQYAIPGIRIAGRQLGKAIIKPDMNVAKLAQEAGVDVTPAMLTQRPLLRKIDAAAERSPFLSSTIRDSRTKASQQWETTVLGKADKLHPTPASNVDVGEAMARQLEANEEARSAYFQPKYAEVSKLAKDVPITLTSLPEGAQALLEDLPEDASRFFPKNLLDKLKQAANMKNETPFSKAADDFSVAMNRGKKFAELDPIDQKTVSDWVEKNLKLKPEPTVPTMTADQAMKLRTQLLETERSLTRNGSALERTMIPKLRAAIDEDIGTSLQEHAPDAHKLWRDTNKEYRDVATNLRNPTAKVIDRTTTPETLPVRMGTKPTMQTEAQAALNPEILPGVSASTDEKAMDQFRRNRFDDLMDRSRTQNKQVGNSRALSPYALERNIAKLPEETLAPVAPDLSDAVTLGKAIGQPEFEYGNPSGTAGVSHMLKLGRQIITRPDKALLQGTIGYLLGKPLTSASVAKSITGAGPSIQPSGPISQALGRMAGMYMPGMPKPFKVDEEDPPATLPADFFNQ